MEGTETYRVLRLCAENYKRIKAADVTPGRNAVIVAGRNKQGKTSLLDSIAAVLGGKKCVAEQPLRQGAESGTILCVLGDERPELLVKRVFSDNGKTALEITSADGYKAPSPQAILDTLCGAIAFDPLSFTRMDDRKQAETLRGLVGLDFTELDAKRKGLYEDRAGVNKDGKRLMAQAEAVTFPDDTPEEEVSVEELMAEQKRRQTHNRANQTERDRLPSLQMAVKSKHDDITRITDRIAEIEQQLVKCKSQLEDAKTAFSGAEALAEAHKLTVKALEDQNVDEVQQQIVAAQSINANVAKRTRRSEYLAASQEEQAKADALTDEIDAIDASKATQLSEVKWPIEGLSFSSDGVLYNDLPFSQASGAEQMSVSFAMSAALNPRLKVAILRDASLLDEEQMKVVCGLAEKYDTQVWLEVVDTSRECGILIEDGTVVSGGTPPTAEPVEKPKRKSRKKKESKPEPTPEPDPEVAAEPEADPVASLPGQQMLLDNGAPF